jgi:hypothetical protein
MTTLKERTKDNIRKIGFPLEESPFPLRIDKKVVTMILKS